MQVYNAVDTFYWTHSHKGRTMCGSGKVQVIIEMPPPKDVAGIQCLLSLIQYLRKIVRHYKASERAHTKDTTWVWDHAQQHAQEAFH